VFSPPRQLSSDNPPSTFIVVIARDVARADVEQVQPAGLFALSWQQPETRDPDARRRMKAEWVT